MFEGVIDPDQVLNAKNMDEFHMALSVPLFGYTTVDEYYSHNDSGGKNVLKIAVSLLFFFSFIVDHLMAFSSGPKKDPRPCFTCLE